VGDLFVYYRLVVCFHQKKPTAPTKPRETTWLTLHLHQQSSLGSVKRIVGDFLFFLKKKVCFLEMLFGVLSVLRHSSAPAFSLIFI
jgi:hypothetical protein